MGQALKVLVVDDEDDVRETTVELLTECGLCIVGIGSAVDALRYLDAHSAEVAAIFTDVVMAGEIDGADLARIVAHSWPEIRLVVTSGCTCPKLPGRVHFLPKPWRFTDVLARLGPILPVPAPVR